jgi:hypothetical protein
LLVYLCVVVYLCFFSFLFAFPHFRTANNIIRGRLNFRCNWCLNDRLRFKMRKRIIQCWDNSKRKNRGYSLRILVKGK